METTLNRATQLLQSGEPEHALLLLNEQNDSSAESEHLKEICKRALSEQYLWLLNEAAKSNQMNEVQTYVNRYLNLIGKDERIARYEKMAKTAFSSNNNHQVPHCSEYSNGKFALISVIFLLLSLLVRVFWNPLNSWMWDFGLNYPWGKLNFIYNFFYLLYIISATFVFLKTEDNCIQNRNITSRTILILVWSGFFLISGIYNMVRGFNASAQWIKLLLVIANISLILSLVKKINEATKIRQLFIIATTATVLDIVRLGMKAYADYAWRRSFSSIGYTGELYNACYNISNILYYCCTILMAITFIVLFIMSQRTKNKQYGTN